MNDFKNKMGEKIKLYSNEKYLHNYMANEYELHDGDADVYMYIADKHDFFDKRTRGHQLCLDRSITKFVEEKTDMLENDVKINLHISCPNLSETDKGRIKHLFKEYYAIELYKAQKTYKEYRKKAILLVLMGVISFMLYFICKNQLLLEVFAFLFSFSLWEAIDSLIYNISEARFEVGNVTQNLLMEIEFMD